MSAISVFVEEGEGIAAVGVGVEEEAELIHGEADSADGIEERLALTAVVTDVVHRLFPPAQ
jgi:hypothetical protein